MAEAPAGAQDARDLAQRVQRARDVVAGAEVDQTSKLASGNGISGATRSSSRG